jgi:hypothetical protein
MEGDVQLAPRTGLFAGLGDVDPAAVIQAVEGAGLAVGPLIEGTQRSRLGFAGLPVGLLVQPLM